MIPGKGLFITGTDTGVGKTLVSALLVLKMRQERLPVSYLKPMETGIADQYSFEHDSDGAKVKKAGTLPTPLSEIVPYIFREPLAPLLAARREKRVVTRNELLATAKKHLRENPFSLIEGAGGLLVPLTPGYLIIDLIKELKLPTLVVCRSTLGGVNHTLMTLRCLRQENITIAGLVVNHLTSPLGPAEQNFRAQIQEFDSAPIIAELPYQSEINYLPRKLLPLCELLKINQLRMTDAQ